MRVLAVVTDPPEVRRIILHLIKTGVVAEQNLGRLRPIFPPAACPRRLPCPPGPKDRISYKSLPVDLAQERAADELVAAADRAGLSIDILVNNAGFGSHGRYETLALEREHEEIMVNVASNAALQPLPFMATYGATKAFVLSFTEALWGENRGGPVRVLTVCPGPTETPFCEVVGTEHGESEKKRTTHQLVLGALRAPERGKIRYIDGAKNRLQARSIRLAPRKARGRCLHIERIRVSIKERTRDEEP